MESHLSKGVLSNQLGVLDPQDAIHNDVHVQSSLFVDVLDQGDHRVDHFLVCEVTVGKCERELVSYAFWDLSEDGLFVDIGVGVKIDGNVDVGRAFETEAVCGRAEEFNFEVLEFVNLAKTVMAYGIYAGYDLGAFLIEIFLEFEGIWVEIVNEKI